MNLDRRLLVRSLGTSLIILIAIGAFSLADWILGHWKETALIRRQALMFRSEIDRLRMTTRNLIPEVTHIYPDPARPKPRRFEVREDGTVAGPNAKDQADQSIVFLGGSTTECNEVSEAKRFPAVVQRELGSAGLSVRVLNGGVRGHTTLDSINSLLNRSGFREANFVVLMHNINDRLSLAMRGRYGAALGDISAASAKSVWLNALDLANSIWSYASYRSNIVFLIRSAGGFDPWTGESTNTPFDEANIEFGSAPTEDTVSAFGLNLRIFVAAARALGQVPVLMTQPLGVHSTSHSQFNDEIRRIAAELDVLLVDISKSFGEEARWAFLSDDIHLNDSGSEAVGEIAARVLLSEFGLARSSIPSERWKSFPLPELVQSCADYTDAAEPTSAVRILDHQGRYPSVSHDGNWLSFHDWHEGRNRIFVWNLSSEELIQLTPHDSNKDERHPTFLDSNEEGFTVVFGSGFSEVDKASPEYLKLRSWPSLASDLVPLPSGLAGSIPAVHDGVLFFAGSEEPRTS